jgi:osmotically-inducible protein OsmY
MNFAHHNMQVSLVLSEGIVMASKATLLISASVLAGALAFSPMVMAQTASQWGNAAIGTGEDAVHSTESAFHKVADDPILTERTKSALAHDPITMNQPIIVAADRGVVILEGRVSHTVAERAVVVAQQVPGARGVENRMLY